MGTRTSSALAKATYELPPNAIGEAIVNAIAHRDYHSNASVEIRLFADRLEVWNPGSLPGTLTTEMLRHDHPSLPNNPLLAESLYLTRYIEKAGFGTQAIIDECRAIGLPEPDFEQRGGSFVVTLWRDWLTNEILDMLNLNERQLKVIALIKQQQKLTTKQYQEITGASRATSKCDLEDFVRKGVLILKGEGRGAYYELSKKRLKWLMKVNASWNPGESRNP